MRPQRSGHGGAWNKVKMGARQGPDIDGLGGHGREFGFILNAVGRSERVLGRAAR